MAGVPADFGIAVEATRLIAVHPQGFTPPERADSRGDDSLARNVLDFYAGTGAIGAQFAQTGFRPGGGFFLRSGFAGRSLLMATRVLLVDDQTETAALVARLLEIYGCDSRFTGEPFEALKIAWTFQPHAVCVDLAMPSMDGYTLASCIRQLQGLEKCRIVALSGNVPDRDRLKAAGIDIHLMKPVDVKTLSLALCEPDSESTRHADGRYSAQERADACLFV
jgi:CheY-like chemotaxis protein